MWVRSQNNGMLIDCNTFKIEVDYIPVARSDQKEKHYLITNDVMQGYPLADYPTGEQALKVLDMLQEHIYFLEKTTLVLTKEDYVFKFPRASVKKI